ncbi:50S ribosomal protein L5 [Candidatus Parcubacteria bacterium A4]|nr:MAG: 50S ribosomal protein L5 [Candidatus Parcubacteria bacterium A4]
MINLKEKYEKEAVPAMIKKFNYRSKMAVPKIGKVIVNCGFGRMVAGKSVNDQKKIQEAVLEDMSSICGQKALLTIGKKSIAGFKIRKGMVLGASVTLRKKRMLSFLDRLINITLPRSRDFRGLESKSFDNSGNLTIGIKEQIIFPEIAPENIKFMFGLEVVVVTTSKKKEEGEELLRLLGFPIKKN